LKEIDFISILRPAALWIIISPWHVIGLEARDDSAGFDSWPNPRPQSTPERSLKYPWSGRRRIQRKASGQWRVPRSRPTEAWALARRCNAVAAAPSVVAATTRVSDIFHFATALTALAVCKLFKYAKAKHILRKLQKKLELSIKNLKCFSHTHGVWRQNYLEMVMRRRPSSCI